MHASRGSVLDGGFNEPREFCTSDVASAQRTNKFHSINASKSMWHFKIGSNIRYTGGDRKSAHLLISFSSQFPLDCARTSVFHI